MILSLCCRDIYCDTEKPWVAPHPVQMLAFVPHLPREPHASYWRHFHRSGDHWGTLFGIGDPQTEDLTEEDEILPTVLQEGIPVFFVLLPIWICLHVIVNEIQKIKEQASVLKLDLEMISLRTASWMQEVLIWTILFDLFDAWDCLKVSILHLLPCAIDWYLLRKFG